MSHGKFHAKMSASRMPRLALCPGSLEAEKGLPDNTNAFAHEGTCAHYLGSLCLIRGVNTDSFAGEILHLPIADRSEGFPDSFEPDDEMIDYVQEYVDYCRNLGGYPTDYKVERLVDYSQWVPDGGQGTADFTVPVFSDNGKDNTLHVVDLKYGRGVQVYAEDNEQLLCYALGAWDASDDVFSHIAVHVHQPRKNHVDVHTYSWDEFQGQMKRISDIAKAVTPDAPRSPGEKQCQFCKANRPDRCKEVAEYVIDVGLAGFDIVNEVHENAPDESGLSKDQISTMLKNRKMTENYLKNVAAFAEEQALDGEHIPGYKLALSNHNRKWADPDHVIELLRKQRKIKKSQYLKESLVSFTVIERIAGKNHPIVTENVIKPEGKPILVPESDKRPEYVLNDTEGFDDLTADPLADFL